MGLEQLHLPSTRRWARDRLETQRSGMQFGDTCGEMSGGRDDATVFEAFIMLW